MSRKTLKRKSLEENTWEGRKSSTLVLEFTSNPRLMDCLLRFSSSPQLYTRGGGGKEFQSTGLICTLKGFLDD